MGVKQALGLWGLSRELEAAAQWGASAGGQELGEGNPGGDGEAAMEDLEMENKR